MDSPDADKGLSFEEICSIVNPIAVRYRMKRVYLFGSRARSDNRSDSDFDFCVLPSDTCSLIQLSGFRLDLVDALNSDVDVICEDSISDEFIRYIESDRRLVYEV